MQIIRRVYLSYLRDRIPDSVHAYIRTWVRKRRTRTLKSKKLNLIETHGTFNVDDLTQELRKLGLKQSGILFVQCSFNDLYTFSGSTADLLLLLKSIVEPTGTLFMPAYTIPDESQIFDTDLEPTYCGIVNEIFRRSPDVIRSLHPRHSICGLGLQAKEMLADHDKCDLADGLGSPMDRIRKFNSAQILTLGLPLGYISFLHWLEDFESEKFPLPVHGSKTLYRLKLRNGGETIVGDHQINPNIAVRLSLDHISKHLSPEAVCFKEYKGIQIGIYSMVTLAEELLALRDRGIVHYR